jgi:4-hydroxy-tetrahydrodipicolinate reductase
MGQVMARGLGAYPQFTVAALVDLHEPAERFGAVYEATLEGVDPARVDAVVDFSNPDGVVLSAKWCATHGVALVVGATGLTLEQREAVEEAATKVGVVMASNFAIGAVLSERFARIAAPYFDCVEIIELHHDSKVDAPSGTSITTARAIAAARAAAGQAPLVDRTTRETLPGARGADGADGVRIHSVRLAGLVAHQEILFGGPGEGLTIRHDSYDRASFVQGVALALDALDAAPRFLEGIDSLL